MEPDRYTLIFNPNAGTIRRLGITFEHMQHKLEGKGIYADAYLCESAQDVRNLAGSVSGWVIIAGGDGTVHALLQAVRTCGTINLGIIPVGSANLLAGALGIPSDIDESVDVIAEGCSRKIDLGAVDGAVFSQAAGVGLHAKVFHLYGERKDKSFVGGTSAAVTALADWEPQMVRLVIDDVPYVEEVTQVTVANTPKYGRQFVIAPDALLDDGLLDVVIVQSLSKVEIVEYALAAMSGLHTLMPKSRIIRAKKVYIKSVTDIPVEVHADAQPVGYTPKTIEVLPGCLEVLVPCEVSM